MFLFPTFFQCEAIFKLVYCVDSFPLIPGSRLVLSAVYKVLTGFPSLPSFPVTSFTIRSCSRVVHVRYLIYHLNIPATVHGTDLLTFTVCTFNKQKINQSSINQLFFWEVVRKLQFTDNPLFSKKK